MGFTNTTKSPNIFEKTTLGLDKNAVLELQYFTKKFFLYKNKIYVGQELWVQGKNFNFFTEKVDFERTFESRQWVFYGIRVDY